MTNTTKSSLFTNNVNNIIFYTKIVNKFDIINRYSKNNHLIVYKFV